MTLIIINNPPDWVRHGEEKPPEFMKKYFPKAYEKELIRYGSPKAIAEYMVDEIFREVNEPANPVPECEE